MERGLVLIGRRFLALLLNFISRCRVRSVEPPRETNIRSSVARDLSSKQ